MSGHAPRPGSLSISSVSTNGTVSISLEGELDLASARKMEERLQAVDGEGPSRVIVDLGKLAFIDSTGLSLLLSVNEMSRDRGFALSIVSTEDDPPGKIFRLTGTHTVLPLVDELPDFGPAA